MFERDYVLRMFTMLGRALARVLFFKEVKSYDSALLEIDNAALSLLGLNTETMERLPVDGFRDILGTDPALLQSKLYAAGVLLKEKAEIMSLKDDEDGSAALYVRSLRLMTLELTGLDEIDGKKGIATVDSVIRMLKEYELPSDLKRRLVDYFEFAGRFDKAEDLIFELVESDPEYLRDGISFYQRLLSKTDSELELGGLPRSEVEEALRELHERLQSMEEPT